ncbi:MAG: MBL fold metallo-hydrolase [Spirochaetes bacterium]|nr:MBL fold metallo-hydrolase [Spirochaetota bacterium]
MEVKNNENLKINILNSGSNGNSIIIENCSYNIIIDIGISKRNFLNISKKLKINLNKRNFLFITHFHDDHVKGLPYLIEDIKPIIFISDKNNFLINIENFIKTNKSNKCAEKLLQFTKKNYIFVFEFNKKNLLKNINNFYFIPIQTYHDDNKSSCFFFNIEGVNIFYLTDTGKIDSQMHNLGFISDLIFLESNYDENMLINGTYPINLKKRIISDFGHLSNKQSIEFIKYLLNMNFINLNKNNINNNKNNNNSINIKNIDTIKEFNYKTFLLCHISENNNNIESIKKEILENLDIYENINNLNYKNNKFEINIIERNKYYSFYYKKNEKKITDFLVFND